ncbi:MAG: dihydroorotase [Gammaproteobacteria bacterium]|nr:dihydroorotase [Gammaproteobacteria bacterium]MDH5727849.1 dihydroorotase [Gammaproteobacteria bacterium]
MRLHIRGGHLVDAKNQQDGICDVFIADGKVVGLGQAPHGFSADRLIDAQGLVVMPGIVDLCARLREPGFENKATIASETAAAAKGGVTTICCPPDTIPIVDTPAVVELITQRAQQAGKARVVTLGAMTRGLEGQQICEMLALKNAGCVGVSNALRAVKDTLVMRRALEYAASHNMTVFIFSEDPWLRRSGGAHEGPVSTRLGLSGIPEIAETIAVARDLALVEATGARAHFCHLSTEKAVRMVARAQHDGLPVTADATIYHLHLNEMDLMDFNVDCHVKPPLRSQRDQAGLVAGLADGVISAVCSDHQPHELDAKLGPFSETESGMSTIEMLLPLGLRLVHDKKLSLAQLVASLTFQPSQILGLDLGHLSLDAVADICIFDPEKPWLCKKSELLSAGKNTAFDSWEFNGQVQETILAGQSVYQAIKN